MQKALSIYKIKTEVLEQLQPTHIITQDQCDVCAVNLPEVERAIAQLTRGMATIREFYSHIPLKPLSRVSFIN